jgi:hypothetical protein
LLWLTPALDPGLSASLLNPQGYCFAPRRAFNAGRDADTVFIRTCAAHVLSIERETEMATEATQVLANFAASLQYEDLPEQVKESSVRRLMELLRGATQKAQAA